MVLAKIVKEKFNSLEQNLGHTADMTVIFLSRRGLLGSLNNRIGEIDHCYHGKK